MKILYALLDSPVGPVAAAWTGSTIVAVHMQEAKDRHAWDSAYVDVDPLRRLREDVAARFGNVDLERSDAGRPARALKRYFEGDVRALDALDVDPGGTPFQARVWKRLRRIPAGRTLTYGELARSIGKPGASRAVGAAVGRNPIPIVIPCHRVVGSDRRLTGFGGGLPAKRWLLEHEGVALPVR